jgi:hypothetical protein
MTDTHPSTHPVEASFADAAKAERAAVQLQEHGIPADRIDIEHGATSAPGRTAAEDSETVTRMAGSWWGGMLVGALAGGLLGALIGLVVSGPGTRLFWGLAFGVGGAGAGLGALYGMFTGFVGRSSRTRQFDDAHRPELRDAVRLLVAVEPDLVDVVRRIVREKGGTLS